MSDAALDLRQTFGVALALEAGILARRMRDTLGPIETKNSIDFCTEADHAVERLVRDRIASTFTEPVIGEEGGGDAAENVWVVDPIDGTSEYIHGTRRWCVALAYISGGRTEIGIIYAPIGDRLFVARRGRGATLNGRPLSVSHLRHGAAPLVEVGWSNRRSIERLFKLIGGLTESGMEFRRHGSGALALAEVAAGLSDGYAELHMNAWDCVAGLLLVHEAGGRVNDFLAHGGLTTGNPVLAATPEIAERLSVLLGEELL
jgi:myo-inositol-1(or 4)-monophosphatase